MNNTFMARYQWGIAGEHEVENMAKMAKKRPLFDDYWDDKYDEVSNIDVPLYVLASFNNPFHVQGSFDTFHRASSTKKWLRVHSSFVVRDVRAQVQQRPKVFRPLLQRRNERLGARHFKGPTFNLRHWIGPFSG